MRGLRQGWWGIKWGVHVCGKVDGPEDRGWTLPVIPMLSLLIVSKVPKLRRAPPEGPYGTIGKN